jgi:hypothetical protein
MSYLARTGENSKVYSLLALFSRHALTIFISSTRIVFYCMKLSAAAGHGNMWRESYTAVMERAVKDMFATVGLNFIGRNYAMGGTGSAPEIAMCAKEVFGTDIDVLSWDTGMTDGRFYAGMQYYFIRAAMLPNRPAFVALHLAGGGSNHRVNVMKELEDIGLTTLLLDPDEETELNNAIPDTTGLTTEEVAAMPEFVRNLKCGVQIEKGDPCGEYVSFFKMQYTFVRMRA